MILITRGLIYDLKEAVIFGLKCLFFGAFLSFLICYGSLVGYILYFLISNMDHLMGWK